METNLGDVSYQHIQNEARLRIVQTLEDFDLGPTEKCVRVNAVSSGLAEEDLEALLQSRVLPSSLMLPKVEGPQEIQWVSHFPIWLALGAVAVKTVHSRQQGDWELEASSFLP